MTMRTGRSTFLSIACLAGAACWGGFVGRSALAQPVPGVGGRVAIEKYVGSGTVTKLGRDGFEFESEAGRKLVVSLSPVRSYNGLTYADIDPLETSVRGLFQGERLAVGQFVAFPARIAGRRVVGPVERLTVVTLDSRRRAGTHDPETLPEDAIFGQFLGKKTPADADDAENLPDGTQRVVIGRIVRLLGRNRLQVDDGETQRSIALADDALLFVDSASPAHVRVGDPVRVEGAEIAEGALFGVKVEVRRDVPPEALRPPNAPVDSAGKPESEPADVAGAMPKPSAADEKNDVPPPRATPGRVLRVN